MSGERHSLSDMRAILVASMLGACSAVSAMPEAREWKPEDGTEVKYRWASPATTEDGKTYPLVLFLHGAGERGDDNKAQLKHGAKAILKGAEKLGEPCFLIAPQCPAESWWAPIDRETMRLRSAGGSNPLLESMLALVRDTIAKHPVDPKRVYLSGLSMGGYASWDLLVRSPGMWACAVPVCGGGDPSTAGKFKDVPVWAFHGEADPVVPVRTTREMIQALEEAGGKPKVTIYPDVQHDSWTRTYDNPAVIRWMFAQKRP